MYALALHNESSCWKIALISLQDESGQIELLRSFHQDEKPLDALKTVLFGKDFSISTAISAEQFILRSIDLDLRGWAHILKVLPFQAEDLIPFPKEQTLLLAFLEKETAQGSTVRLVATQQSFIQNHLSHFAEAGIEPHHTTTTVHALKRWAKFVAPSEASVFLLYLNRECSFGALIQNREVLCFKTFSIKNAGEWLRVKAFLESQLTDSSSLPWLIAGETELLEDPPIALSVSKQHQEYAIPIGICLETLYKDGQSIQWRQDGLASAKQGRKRRKKIFSSLALFLCTAAVLGPLGHFFLEKHQNTLLSRAEAALETLHIPNKGCSLEESIELLMANSEELSREKQFGPYSPALSYLLSRINQLSMELDKEQLPIVKALRYSTHATKAPSLEVEWLCSSVESLHALKMACKRAQNVKLTASHENKTTLFTTFEIE